MTMKEIQSIVAGGSNEGSLMQQTLSKDKYFDDDVEDIVTSVQKVLNEEVEAKKNTSNEHNILDTPDVSSTWSIILPAIFGNTGDDIRPHKPQIAMTPDAVIVDATEKPDANKIDVKVKASNSGSQNKIDDPAEKKTTEKPTIADEPIVHITKKKPVNSAFEASTPRSNVGGYQEHIIDDLHTNHNHSFHGYRHKTTPAPEISTSSENNIKSSKPTPSRFVTRRRPTTAATDAPQFEETTMEHSTHVPIKESTSKPATEIATEIVTEGSTEEASVYDTNEPLTTESIFSPELTTYDQRYAETTTAEADTESNSGIVTSQTTLQDEINNDGNVMTTEYSNVFDSSNSFNQIMESLKDDPESESVGMQTENNAMASTMIDDVTTTESFMVDENDDRSTESEMVKIPSIDVAQRINQSNVYLNQEIFVDETEPLVFDIPTTTDFTPDTTEHNEDATYKDEDLALPIFEEVKLQYPETSSIFEEKNPVVQQVDNFIHDNTAEFVDSLAVESVNNENKVANIVSLDNLTLSEYIGQAATVASILSNDADTMPIREIVSQLVLTPQLRHDEPEVTPTTNVPANFHEMEVLSLKNEDSLIPQDDVSYETSVIKETSSISMSSNKQVEKLNETTANDSSDDVVKQDLSSELFKLEPDASTEISVESDVHEELHMIKLKMPPKVAAVNSASLTFKENKVQEEVTTFATVTEMIQETSTVKDEVSATVRLENQNNDATTMVAETQEDIQSTTVNANSDSFDRMTPSDNVDSTTQTTNHPPSENKTELEGNFVSDILDTIGMIDEDVIAQKFNITFNEEADDEDEIDLLNESTTVANEITTEKMKNEQTTMYNRYKEEFENEIIKKLQETLEERLHPKTDSADIDGTLFTTEANSETTTAEQIDVSTIKQSEVATENVLNSTEENLIDLSQKENVESTTETELYDGTVKTSSSETTEFSNDFTVEKNNDATYDNNSNQDEVSKTEPTTDLYPKDEEVFIKLGETTILPTTSSPLQTDNDITTQATIINVIPSKKHAALKIDDRTSGVGEPTQHFRPHPTEQKLFHVNTVKPSLKMPPSINTLKIKVSNSNRRPMPVKLDPAPKQALGLEQTTVDSNADILEFTKLCNELAFTFWKSLTSEGISSARSLVISPFALTSMLAMIFLGARGSTSGEMNEMLRLDDMVTFNPHVIFRNITDSVENTKDAGIANSAFVRELFSDRSKGKILSFYKDKAQQFYSGHVEEVNFNVINDIIRRRTNLLVKRHTWSKITEYIKTNNIWLNPPLAGLSANIFQTDCSKATVNERDGEMFFQVLPAIRQRRLVPIPAAVYKSGSGFMAGMFSSDHWSKM